MLRLSISFLIASFSTRNLFTSALKTELCLRTALTITIVKTGTSSTKMINRVVCIVYILLSGLFFLFHSHSILGDCVGRMKKRISIKSTHCSGILGLTNPQSMDK